MKNNQLEYFIFNEYYDEINNEFWSGYKTMLLTLIDKRFSENEIAYDLGCGTGEGIKFLTHLGFKNIKGIDLSEKMIKKARQKFKNIDFVIGNMLDIKDWAPGSLVICNFDAINYLVGKDDWLKLFKIVSKLLNRNGMFIFDALTTYDHKEIWPQSTRVIEKDEFVLINHGEWNKNIALMYYTWFIKKENIFKRYSEIHRQKSYPVYIIKRWLNDSNLNINKIIDADSGKKHSERTQRLLFKCTKI